MTRQSNNINIDRSFFNANTRQDKDWKKQSDFKKKINKFSVNLDRDLFNQSTYYDKKVDKDTIFQNRNWNDYNNINSYKNKYNYDDSGKRIYSLNTRTEKILLDTEQNNFVNRSFNSNPYVSNQRINPTRIKTIDTKNNNSDKLKKNVKKNKFNPYEIY